MPEPLRRLAVLTHVDPAATRRPLAELGEIGRRLGLELVAPAEEYAKHPELSSLGFSPVDDEGVGDAALCLVFGGDGAILRALGRFLDTAVPTLGINYGNVGFLSSLSRGAWQTGLETILGGTYVVLELLTVDVQLEGKTRTAVNDVILSRVAPRRVLQVAYEVAGVTVGEMFCDGLIIASPTGSTAYSLSCGGPIVEWSAPALVLNFIAPHSLGFRPMVLRVDHVITATNKSPVEDAEVVVDGDTAGLLKPGQSVKIVAGTRRAKLLMSDRGSFYQNVQEKLFDRHDAR
jgi:NAD+ kinase